jgi:hypothetical protein
MGMVTLFSGCSADEDPAAFLEGEVRLVMPAGLNSIETHFFIERDQRSFIANVLSANNLQPEDVTQILPLEATFETRSGIPLDYINEISIRAVSIADPNISVEMFYLDFVQFNEDGLIQLLPSIADLKQILLDESYDIEFRVTLRQFSAQTVIADFRYRLGVYYEQ